MKRKIFKKMMALALAVTIPLGSAMVTPKNANVVYAAEQSSLPFTDITPGTWQYNTAKYVYDNKIVMGTSKTTFSPNQLLTRGQFITLLWRMEGSPSVAYADCFQDVKEGQFCSSAIQWAYNNQLVAKQAAFHPNAPISRQEFMVFLYRFSGFKGYDLTIKERNSYEKLEDYDTINSYAREAMNWAYQKGFIGANGKFNAKGNTTRIEGSAMLMRYIEAAKAGADRPKEVKLSGKAEDIFEAENYCYLVSDKYVIYMEPGITLPGNSKTIIDEIVDKLEKNIGLPLNPKGYSDDNYLAGMEELYPDNYDWKYQDNPKGKMPIYMMIDKEQAGFISWCCKEICVINDVPFYNKKYYEKNFERWGDEVKYEDKNVDFFVFAHELTHAIYARNGYENMSGILAEGLAEYYGSMVNKEIISLHKELPYSYMNQDDIQSSYDSCPEDLFDYYIHSGTRFGIYTIGRAFVIYLMDQFGEKCLSNLPEINKYQNKFADSLTLEDEAGILKTYFGDDLFEKFGSWLANNKERFALQ